MNCERDLAFVESILRGDEAAFSAFFEATFQRVFSYVSRRSPTPDGAEVLTTAAMSEIVERLGAYTGRVSLDAWSFALARRTLEAQGWRELARAGVGGKRSSGAGGV